MYSVRCWGWMCYIIPSLLTCYARCFRSVWFLLTETWCGVWKSYLHDGDLYIWQRKRNLFCLLERCTLLLSCCSACDTELFKDAFIFCLTIKFYSVHLLSTLHKRVQFPPVTEAQQSDPQNICLWHLGTDAVSTPALVQTGGGWWYQKATAVWSALLLLWHATALRTVL